ncbi:hypothetical protein [Ekhidna sp.]|uniref:hypothetical protein n=1 Tax=Ekhidna sp. TaxID=2608089 RepID=UPI003B5AC791
MHFIEYEEIENKTIAQAIDYIESIDGIKLAELKVRDLSYQDNKIILPGEGVYVFREGVRPVYVGKVSSMSFTERIAKHFDVREFAWFNRLLELVNWFKLEDQIKREFYIDASKYAFEHLNLVMINFKSRERINRTESLFRAAMEPLNGYKNVRIIDYSILIKEY